MFKAGDLVMITYPPMAGDLCIIIKPGTPQAADMIVAAWLVHLTSGRRKWFRTRELTNV